MEARRSREENATCWLIARGFGAKGDNVHVANMVDQERIMPLLDGAKELFPRLIHTLGWTLVTGAKRKVEAGH
jgi:hypothetical protein